MPLLVFAKSVIKSAFKRPATVRYPFEKKSFPVGSRGSLQIDINQCTFCTLCQKRCPTDALKVDRTARTWEVERLNCIVCGYCVEACPKKCLTLATAYSASVTSKTGMEKFQGPPKEPAKTEVAAA